MLRKLIGFLAAGLMAAACTYAAPPPHVKASSPIHFDHIVIVVEENHSYSDVIGDSQAPYITTLASGGANMTNSHGVTHPSEPNYLALFAGDTFSVQSLGAVYADACPLNFGNTPNLGSELLAAADTFTGYVEDLPAVGSIVCTSGEYARKHAPWVNFSNVPGQDSVPFSQLPSDYSTLPTVSFVVPNLLNDMHDGTITQGDIWLQANLSGYAQWAKNNNSLLIVTWDESNSFDPFNTVPTIFYGARVATGNYSENINHYNVLATIEQMYGLPKLADSVGASGISDIWN